MNRTGTDAALAELYAQIPAIPACDGSCWPSCGPIGMSARERQRLRDAGYEIADPVDAMLTLVSTGDYRCEALTPFNRCGAYEVRPVICRLWGAAEGMECPRGCLPDGGYLSRDEAAALIGESLRIGGAA